MSTARRIISSLVPQKLRAAIKSSYRDWVFSRAFRRFLRDPEGSIQPGSRVLADLIFGWGNEDWSALDDYLVGCIKEAMIAKDPILECGSGLSTVLVGAVARSRGLSHWALEHHSEWAERVRNCLEKYGIDSVVVCSKPLKDRGEFAWYDPPLETMPDSFGFVICDGPPGVTKGGRYGLVPVMNGRLKEGCTIFLDDAGRLHEQEIAGRWATELKATVESFGTAKPYVKLTVGLAN